MSDSTWADGELLRRYATAGCERSFALVVARHAALVRGVCRRVTAGSGVDPDDVAQIVFATLARRAAALTELPSVAGWLHRAAWNAATRHRRDAATRGRHERAAGEQRLAVAAAAGAADGSPARPLDRRAIAVEVHRAVNALPEPFHVAVVLHDLQGWTVREVADLLGAPAGTVAARVSRGRRIVRDRLDHKGLHLAAGAVAMLLAAERAAEAAGAAVGGAADLGAGPGGGTTPAGGPGALAPAVAAVAPLAVAGMAAAAGYRPPPCGTGLGGGGCRGGTPAAAAAGGRGGFASGFGQAAAVAAVVIASASLGFGAARLALHALLPDSSAPGPAVVGTAGGYDHATTANGGSNDPRLRRPNGDPPGEKKQKPAPLDVAAPVVPEPGSAAVLATAGAGLLMARRQRCRRP